MFFGTWSDLARVFIVGVLAYLTLIFVLRVSGKRTLSKMNAFDLIVTVALGSTLATILLSRDVSLVEGVAAMTLLVFMQYAITWLSVRSATVRRLIKAEPTLVFHRGEFLRGIMRRERVLETEIRAAVRDQGHAGMDPVEAVVLETDGSFTVLQHPSGTPSALIGVAGADRDTQHGQIAG